MSEPVYRSLGGDGITTPATTFLRILTLVTDLDKGGVQRTAQNFAEAFAQLGHDSRVLALAGGVREGALSASGIAVSTGLDDLTLAELQQWSPDFVHLHAHLLDPIDVYRVLDSFPDARVVEKNVFSVPSPWSSRIHASHQLSQWCLRLYGERSGRSGVGATPVVIPNPVDVGAFSPATREAVERLRRQLSIPEEALVLGRVGQSFLSKWSVNVIHVFEQMASDARVHLLLVNPPAEITAAAHRSQHNDRIRIVDRIDGDDQLSAAYTLMDVFVHLAEGGESFGNVLLEAQLCETPVVTFSTPWADNSQVEVVSNGVGGFVATTMRGFRQATSSLLRNPHRRTVMGGAGRIDAQRFDRLRIAQQVVDIAVVEHGTWKTPAATPTDFATLYTAAFDPPSRLARTIVRFPRLRLLLKYISGFKPWSHLLSRPVAIPLRQLSRTLPRGLKPRGKAALQTGHEGSNAGSP